MNYTLNELQQMADTLKIEYHTNIGITKLEERVTKAALEMGTSIEELYSSINKQPTKDNTIMVKPEETLDPIMEKEIERLKNLTFNNNQKTNSAITSKRNEAKSLKEANRLIRVLIIPNNKNKTSYQSDIFTVSNASMSITKCVPFNVPTHIPMMMYNMLKEKKCQVYHKKKSPNMFNVENTIVKLIDEFNITVLPPLTTDEFLAIQQKQLAEGMGND